jgi:hypothetical protein
MTIITMRVEEIRESYFYDATEDHESFPTVHRASLLNEEFEGTAADLENDLLGWNSHFLHWSQMLWYSEEHLAAFLQLGYGPMTEIYLFTFADLLSLQAGIDEIKEVCRQKR